MTCYDKRFWLLVVGLSGVAGYVDAIGFIKLAGLFVSFMSGNSTWLGVGAVTDPQTAVTAMCVVSAFVAGVMASTLIAVAAGSRRKPVVLVFVAAILAIAAFGNGRFPDEWTAVALAMSMGAVNTVFQRSGEVSIGVTYMTGTLVKLGQRMAGALVGGPPWAWLPYLVLWGTLVGGAAVGTIAHSRRGTISIWIAAAAMMLLSCYAAILGPVEPAAARSPKDA
jgi:uncharacterized membrane protein YoaK (UPF0700 family)